MMLLNQPPLVNGSLGEVVGFNQGEDGTLESVRVRTQYGDQDIERHAWYQVTTNEQGRQEEDLSRYFRQFPLQLAWAVTIHKAQGMSFDTCCINLGERGAFCEGQAYVGLSRVRSIGGLFLKERLEEEDIMFDERVQQFYKTL
jgi:ATP-dependent exoDNAse (exonuclease V) alpha subunit